MAHQLQALEPAPAQPPETEPVGATGIVYQTEDHRTAGFYRFLPREPGQLAEGGELQMLGLAGAIGFDTRIGQRIGARFPVRWIPIGDPDPDDAGAVLSTPSSASFTARSVGKASATSCSISTTFVPAFARRAYYPRTPPFIEAKSYSVNGNLIRLLHKIVAQAVSRISR